jgi:UDP-N-acetylmuramate-alanine ligase
MDTSTWDKMPQEQVMRTKYVAAIMQGNSKRNARKIAGAHGKNYHSSVLQHLLEYGTLHEAGTTGPPPSTHLLYWKGPCRRSLTMRTPP